MAGLKWDGSSSFHVPLRLRSNIFHNASLHVHLIPRELPLNWLVGKLKKKEETAVFQADLDWAPPFNLELESYRLFARTRKDLADISAFFTTETRSHGERRKKPKAGETAKDTKDDKGFGLDFLRVPLCPRRLALALSVTPCLRGENALSVSSLLVWPNQRRCY
ncbi:MAG: hypothetical protein DMG60_22785 [Acidobacteria bacterium]|nr:MAG: hypothetical protein DMG60_22785 [Acidobacteriota bacterium]